MNTNPKASPYRIYLLTLWAEQGPHLQTPPVWRFSLKDPRTGQQQAYANLTALVTALVEEIARIAEAHSKESEGNSIKDVSTL